MAEFRERRVEPLDPGAIEPGLPAVGDSTVDRAWCLILEAAKTARELAPDADAGYALEAGGKLARVADADAALLWRHGRFTRAGACSDSAAALLDLYLPVCAAGPRGVRVTGHLGQSLDGHIATATGDSSYVTGAANIVHLHRMRALADAVVVGAGTVEADDPELTTRLVPGPNPARVIIDPSLRLAPDRRVFTDGAAPTLVACAGHVAAAGHPAELLRVPGKRGRLDLAALLTALAERGVRTVFVEGGGVTVSAFLAADLLDRLQIAIAPLLTGQGRPGLSLPARLVLADCLRPAHRVFAMGADVLFDCDLRARGAARTFAAEALRRVL